MCSASVAAAQPAEETPTDYDLVIRGGSLYLGGLEPLVVGDVGIRGDRIVAVGQTPGTAAREIDASGKVVAPGFIDLHSHSDEVFRRISAIGWLGSIKQNSNYLTQGVTTIVTGNCGSGFANPEAIQGWFERIESMPFGSNVIHLVPHGQLRLEVMGGSQAEREDPRPTPEEMAKMKEMLAAGMQAGAWGLATGLEYDPGARTETEELVELARVVGKYGGVYASHTRHEGPDPDKTLRGYAEAIEIGERAGVPAHISHIKLAGAATHGLAHLIIQQVQQARARGVRVTADQYPYPAGSTTLSFLAPAKMRDGIRVLDRYCEDPGRDELRRGVKHFLLTETPAEGVTVALHPKWWLNGKSLAEIAAEREQDPVDTGMDLVCGWPALAIFHSQSEQVVQQFMTQDWVATASDGAVWPGWLGRFIHPRAYGTFPRKLHKYAIQEKLISLPFALRSMTELPAEAFGIPERGKLQAGYFADLVVFDPDKIQDVATFENSGQTSLGIEHVLVNGELALFAGRPTNYRYGRALRHEASQAQLARHEMSEQLLGAGE